MSRGFLDSPWPYFVAAGALVALAVASQFEIRTPSRKTAPVERLLDLLNHGVHPRALVAGVGAQRVDLDLGRDLAEG